MAANPGQNGSAPVETPSTWTFKGPGFTGKVMAGALPVMGAAVQVYAAGIAGNGSAPTQLLAAATVTDTTGSFHVAEGTYGCPSQNSVLLLVALGGSTDSNPNGASKLITAPGTCGSMGEGSVFTINEVTTVAAAFALRPFFSQGGQLGSTATNTRGLGLAVATLGRLVDLGAGTAPGKSFPPNGTAPVAKLNALANVLHGCAAGEAGKCATLFAAASLGGTGPVDTLEAALSIANHPAVSLPLPQAVDAAFTPTLTATPADWTLAIPFTGGGMQGPAGVSIDGMGQVWVVNYFGVAGLFANSGAPVFSSGITGGGLQESYGGAVDANGRMWVANEQTNDSTMNNGLGSISVLDDQGPALPGSSVYLAGGLDFPVSIAFDRAGTAWVVDYGDSHVTLLNASGGPQSGTSGYVSSQLAFPVAVAVDSHGFGWVANQGASTVTRVAPDGSDFTSFTVGDAPSAVAVDAADNVWTANYYGNSVGLVSPAGRVLSGAGFTGGGLTRPSALAVDGGGSVWVANYRAPGVSVLAGAQSPQPGAALFGVLGLASDLGMLETFGIALDAAGDVWLTSYGDNRLVEIVGAAEPVQTPLLGGVRVP